MVKTGARLQREMRKSRTKSRYGGKSLARSVAKSASTLVNSNITIGGQRTSMRLETVMWDAFEEICHRENLTRHELCGKIAMFSHASSLTAAIRVFIVSYFRAAATEEGHASIGHGTLYT